jgi:hypothetical protein
MFRDRGTGPLPTTAAALRAPGSAVAGRFAVPCRIDTATGDACMDNERVRQLERQHDRVAELRGYL